MRRDSECSAAMFWPPVPRTLDVRVAAAGIAVVNFLGDLAGFFGPSVMGQLEETTGSTDLVLHLFSAVSVVALLGVRGLWRRRRPLHDEVDVRPLPRGSSIDEAGR